MYNFSYSVPALFFNIYKTSKAFADFFSTRLTQEIISDGVPITLIEDCQTLLNIPKLEGDRYVIMQQEHPSLHVPFMTFHPCKTSEIMNAFAEKT